MMKYRPKYKQLSDGRFRAPLHYRAMYFIYKWFWISYFLMRYGPLTETQHTLDAYGPVMEIEYKDSKGRHIGHWSYGYFDPTFSYQGQPAIIKNKY